MTATPASMPFGGFRFVTNGVTWYSKIVECFENSSESAVCMLIATNPGE